ncbi:hypothetical protein GCM10027280_55830 [Micromonospora polyrhachis]|uniref:Uncharacterized protein n=1 Tax=Micromonospora polyrhachis TaxID=1282883 RepID=A0A7W7STZ0_9ACTN|nr:hypothetical protein [Micromonospora polyrhachis]MBB4960521.1 hypothetical protein [Micromonospora polyrhachis]
MVTGQRRPADEPGWSPAGHGLVGVADAGAFLARLNRLDRTAVVRLRSVPPSESPGGVHRTALWARLPWNVLVGRMVAGVGPGDVTVAVRDLLAELARNGTDLPYRRDADWRWPLPPSASRVVEMLPGAELRRIAAAAAGTLRSAEASGVGGRAVGQRAVRDALLDHVAVVVTQPAADGAPPVQAEVSQRLVQGIVRMGFLGPAGPAERAAATEGTADADGTPTVGSIADAGGTEPAGVPGDSPVQVRLAGNWIGLSAPYGVAWSLKVSNLVMRPVQVPPNG